MSAYPAYTLTTDEMGDLTLCAVCALEGTNTGLAQAGHPVGEDMEDAIAILILAMALRGLAASDLSLPTPVADPEGKCQECQWPFRPYVGGDAA